jgi:dihydrofolate synthase/folylpolyglutamate synthase
MSIDSIKDIENFLAKYIPQRVEDNFFGEKGLDRVRYFASLLNNPQKKLKVIHIAGTSGKGSTATILSYVLRKFGFKIGLQISPHLLDIRERCQLSNSLLKEERFVRYFKEIMPAIKKMSKSDFGQPTYFEIITLLAWYIFEKEKVDYAIVETGLGGLYDATNILDNKDKIVILTKIGKDHTQILGKTLKEITEQKVGIIHKKNIVFSAEQGVVIKNVINSTCLQNKTVVKYNNGLCKFSLSLKGYFQKENCSLALSVATFLSERDNFSLSEERIQKALLQIKFLGRFDERVIGNKKVIFDGAHNVQKMTAFLNALKKKYPQEKFNFLIAFKRKKDFSGMLELIVGEAENIIVTDFSKKYSDLGVASVSTDEVVKILKDIGHKKYKIIPDCKAAFEKSCNEKNENILVVTGSFYLIAEIYKQLKL